jgi:hypothetical protein
MRLASNRRAAIGRRPSCTPAFWSANDMQLAKFVKFREEKFGGVLFETRSEKVFTLNPTAAAVVREIAAGGGPLAVSERLKSRFSDPAGAIEREVVEFVACLRQRGLLED